MIPQCAVNYSVTLAWGRFPRLHSPAVWSNVHPTHDAAVAIPDTVVASTLSRQLVEAREQENILAAFPPSPNRRNSHVSLPCMHKDAPQVADGARVSNDANREQFHVALLEDRSFFAHLVLRHVRARGNSSRCLLDRASPRMKLNIAKVSQTAPRSSSNILPQHLPMEEHTLQPEAASPFLQTLWVEVGCRHAQTLVAEKERHEYRENSKPAV